MLGSSKHRDRFPVIAKMKPLLLLLLGTTTVCAQLAVTVTPPKLTGQKALVKLDLVNRLGEPVESARASVFLADPEGKVVAQGTRWVIGGGDANRPALAVGATNHFHFVVNAERPFSTTNLTPRVVFTRLVLPNGKVADPVKDVAVTSP
jgi:hypothetical protein